MPNVSGNADFGEGDDEGRPQTAATGGGAPKSTTIHQSLIADVSSYDKVERFATMTECLGYESITQITTPTGGVDAAATAELKAARLRMGNTQSRRSRQTEEEEAGEMEVDDEEEEPEALEFPPPLTTLNENGRLRFEMIKTRENRRLTITMEEIVPPRVVQIPRTTYPPPPNPAAQPNGGVNNN